MIGAMVTRFFFVLPLVYGKSEKEGKKTRWSWQSVRALTCVLHGRAHVHLVNSEAPRPSSCYTRLSPESAFTPPPNLCSPVHSPELFAAIVFPLRCDGQRCDPRPRPCCWTSCCAFRWTPCLALPQSLRGSGRDVWGRKGEVIDKI